MLKFTDFMQPDFEPSGWPTGLFVNKSNARKSENHQVRINPTIPRSSEPYLGSYDVEDSCQYQLCGPKYAAEFAGSSPKVGSCSGDCDALARKLVNSKFKRELMWGMCTRMCREKYPNQEYR